MKIIFDWFLSEIDACQVKPCLNGGTCQKQSLGTFLCECPLGYHGPICDQDTNLCSLGVCQNNAKCIDGIGANYTCICQPGFTGISCETKLSACSSQPCLNDGNCTDLVNCGFVCNCPIGTTGKSCEISKHIDFSKAPFWGFKLLGFFQIFKKLKYGKINVWDSAKIMELVKYVKRAFELLKVQLLH